MEKITREQAEEIKARAIVAANNRQFYMLKLPDGKNGTPIPGTGLMYVSKPIYDFGHLPLFGEFDHAEFWQTMREWSKANTVLISEYTAPPDFVPVWQQRKTTRLRDSTGHRCKTIETVWMHESIAPKDTFKLTTQEGLFDVQT